MPDPNCPKREGRTLILCFDGTGDSFDKDVSRLISSRARQNLNALFIELEYRAVPVDANEG